MHKVDSKMEQKVDIEVSNADKCISKTLNPEEIKTMEFYSKFSPTSVTLSHFLDHSSGGGTVEDSFLFLRREIPVRLANMMMELEVCYVCHVLIVFCTPIARFRGIFLILTRCF